MTDHTSEPWGKPRAKIRGWVALSQEDYDRAKACVSACAGIPTAQLKDNNSVWNWLEKLRQALEHIEYKARQYADGAEDAHYLAREMANLEAVARAALAPFQEDSAGIPTEPLGDVQRLIQALEFYAAAWEGHAGDSGPGGNTPADPEQWPSEELLDDGGYAARAALAPFRKD